MRRQLYDRTGFDLPKLMLIRVMQIRSNQSYVVMDTFYEILNMIRGFLINSYDQCEVLKKEKEKTRLYIN